MEVVLPDHGCEVVFWHSLTRRCHGFKFSEALGVVYTLFKQIELRLADSHLSIETEQALSRIIEGIEAHWLESQVL